MQNRPPIVVRNLTLDLCFAGRLKGDSLDEREWVWIDQVVDPIVAAFDLARA